MRDLSTVPFGLDMTARVNSDQAARLLLAMSPLSRPQPRARITGERCRITWRAGALAAVEVPLGLIDDFRRQLHEPPPLTASAWGACRSCTELHDMDALLWIDGVFTCWRCHVKPLPRPRNPWNEHDQPDVPTMADALRAHLTAGERSIVPLASVVAALHVPCHSCPGAFSAEDVEWSPRNQYSRRPDRWNCPQCAPEATEPRWSVRSAIEARARRAT